MHPWEKTYKENKFKINTHRPSVIVEQNKKFFHSKTKVLDIGCGNGRNSIFTANLGCEVDAIDVADLGWGNSLIEKLRDKIKFIKGDIIKIDLPKNFYDVVMATRLIQYIDSKSLQSLFKEISESIRPNGIFILSYNRTGGIHNKQDIEVLKFSHDPSLIKTLLEENFSKVEVSKGSKISKYVGYTDAIDSYDIKCLK